MKKALLTVLCLMVCLALVTSASMARKSDQTMSYKPEMSINKNRGGNLGVDHLFSTAVQGTTILGTYTYDSGGGFVPEGWVAADLTAQSDDYFHVDDFAGLGGGDFGGLLALEGFQSMWCGARPDAGSQVLCGYVSLPGYGTNWNQALCSDCFGVTGDLNVSYLASWDSETGWDWTSLEYDVCDDFFNEVQRHENVVYDSLCSVTIPDSLHSGSVSLRFHFTSDGSYNDEDGFWNSDGAFILDSLRVWDDTGDLNTEDFEGESVGAGDTDDLVWESCTPPGYGDFSDLYSGVTQVNKDPCDSDITGIWGFLTGSTANYSCGGYPGQIAIPYENLRGQYITNEIWSPVTPFVGTGTQVILNFDVYRDLQLNPLIFYIWHVRSFVAGCPQGWIDDNTVYFGPLSDWFAASYNSLGQYIVPGASDIQVSLGVWDMGLYWTGVYGDGSCHANAPYFDNVDLLRIATLGPQWGMQPWHLFQDNFAEDGTTTGTVRIETANDILPQANPNYRRGDSLIAAVTDPVWGIAPDAYTGVGPAVYGYVSVRPNAPVAKRGAALSDDATRWPVVDSTTGPQGYTWYIVRMDTSFTNQGSPIPDEYCLDLNDNLFTPGDTIYHFLAAQSADGPGSWTYYQDALRYSGDRVLVDVYDASGAQLSTDDINIAYNHPMEVTCLPTVQEKGGDILYVDHGDGRSAQPAMDVALEMLGILDKVDRYDNRGSSSSLNNGPGATVQDVFQQIIPVYRKIIWGAADIDDGAIASGAGFPGDNEKHEDFLLLYTFLDQHENNPGLYLHGEGIAEEWAGLTGANALNLKGVYMNFNLVQADHRAIMSLNPLVIGEPGGMFDHLNPDTLVAYGGCPAISQLDVMDTGGGSSVIEATYNGNAAWGAVLSQTTGNTAGSTARVVLSGFPFEIIRDDRPAGVPDRAEHLYDIITFLQNTPEVPTGVKTSFSNSLSQNYPNPFNPQTSITFTVKELSPVTVKVYNVAGQLVRTLVNDERTPGDAHTITWDGRNDAGMQVASGVYFYRLVAKNFTQTKKMVLLK